MGLHTMLNQISIVTTPESKSLKASLEQQMSVFCQGTMRMVNKDKKENLVFLGLGIIFGCTGHRSPMSILSVGAFYVFSPLFIALLLGVVLFQTVCTSVL